MRAPVVVLIALLAAAVLVWLWFNPPEPGFWMDRGAGELASDFDVSLLDVRSAVLVAGPPDGHPCRADVTEAAIEGLALRLATDGFRPAMRRGARPRPTVEVADKLSFAQRVPPERLSPEDADSSIHLAIERFELLAWQPPAGDVPGEVQYSLQGRVWVQLPADGSERRFLGDFAGLFHSRVEAADLAGAPSEPELATAFLFGRRLLETWQRGLVWRSPRQD